MCVTWYLWQRCETHNDLNVTAVHCKPKQILALKHHVMFDPSLLVE